jgi:small conductance mechanosensitive channel
MRGLALILSGEVFGSEWFRTDGVVIAIVLVIAIVVSRLGTLAVRRYRKRLEGTPNETGPLEIRRAATIATTLATTIRVAVWTVAGLIILDSVGVSVGPLLASAGIIGIALSFGAQGIVKDFLTGFFVLVEDQYAVGDVVELTIAAGQPLAGRVETMTLRATAVRAVNGTLEVTGNGNIVAVRNESRGRGELRVEIELPEVTNLAEARSRLERAVEEIRADEQFRAALSSGPTAVDVVPTPGGGAVAIVTAETLAARRKRVYEALHRRLALSLLSPDGRSRP